MKLTIDNFDGAGARDYTATLSPEAPPRILRRLNRPSEFRAALLADTAAFVVPAEGARVLLERGDGVRLFTGYLSAAVAHEYLGWGERGPVYRYAVKAVSDEFLLDRKVCPDRAPLTGRTLGEALKALTEDLLPDHFDLSDVQDICALTAYDVTAQKSWSEHAAALALRGRACYRAHDGAISFQPVAATTHVLDESSPLFSPEALKLDGGGGRVNDVTIVGNVEPLAHVKDYFLGDGLTLYFDLSHVPFTRQVTTFLEDEYKEAALSPQRWSVADPSHKISLAGGKLQIAGGTGVDGATTVRFVEPIEIGGALLLQHGEVTFTAASDGVLGGIYNGGVGESMCVAGFRITPNGSQSNIQAFIFGAAVGSPIATVAGHRYALATRIYALEMYRSRQVFHSSAHPAGSGRGGENVASKARVVLEVHEIDPADPGSLVAPSTILYDNVLSAPPGFCIYALVNSSDLHASIAFTRAMRLVDAEVRAALPGEAYRTRLTGPLSEGGECGVSSAPALKFWTPYLPPADQRIVVRYRSSGRAMARVTDPASIAAEARGDDDGVLAAVHHLASPAARSSEECETAARALLDDSIGPPHSGQYETWSDFLPGGAASDVWPGDAVTVTVPSRSADFTAIVREVAVEVADPANDGSHYRFSFATDSAAPIALDFDPARLSGPIDVTATTTSATSAYLPDLADAEITDTTSTAVTIDAGVSPPAGGGIEVRRSDYEWGPLSDRNLIGCYSTRTFTVPRLSRVQDCYLRQYDASSPRKYSRHSTALHLDYPL